MANTLIDAKLTRQNVALIKPCINRLVMFTAVVFPPKLFLQQSHGFCLVVVNVVENGEGQYSANCVDIEQVWQTEMRVGLQLYRSKAPIDILDVSPIGMPIRPSRNTDRLGSEIHSRNDVTNAASTCL